MGKHIITGEAVLPKLLEGVNLIANAVKRTLGPDGRNAVYERLGDNLPVSTRDGVTVAEQIESDDIYANIGVVMLKGVAREAVDQSGDGTTTATLLAQAIFAEGVKAVTVGANPVALKRGIERATNAVVAGLREMARPVSGDMIRQVATISANNDPFLGGLIADAMEKAGEDGVVTVEVSRKPESSLELVDGLQLGTGYLSPSFITAPERNECVLEDVAVFIHEKKLATILSMLPLIQSLAKEGKSILVIAEDVTDEALGILAVNTERTLLRACAIKAPGGLDHLQDIAALTGARVLTETLGVKLQDVNASFLGHASKVIVKPHVTTIVADAEPKLSLNRRLAELRTQVTEAGDEGARLRLQGRLARLAGGIAVIKVGGNTELEMLERKDRIEDAMHATRCAQKEGVLPGGGIALLRCGNDFIANTADGDEDTGAKIVWKACKAPLQTLAENGGESADYIIRQVLDNRYKAVSIPNARGTSCYQREDNSNYGWNARTREFGDMIEFGVLDPLRVVRVALESAASVAALMLITHTLVGNERPK